MPLRFHDARTGRPAELRPAASPRVALAAECPEGAGWDALRCRIFLSVFKSALEHLGLAPADAAGEPDVSWGARDQGGLWLKPGAAADAEISGLDAAALRLYCLRGHYRAAPPFSPEGLAAAAEELQALRAAAARLSAARGALAPSPSGLAGYKKKFRDALGADLDTTAAISSLWDALKPGALSPGSQLAALREADQVLGLGIIF